MVSTFNRSHKTKEQYFQNSEVIWFPTQNYTADKLSVKFKKENKDIFRHAGSQILTPTRPYIRQQMEDMLYQTNEQAEEEKEGNQETGAMTQPHSRPREWPAQLWGGEHKEPKSCLEETETDRINRCICLVCGEECLRV